MPAIFAHYQFGKKVLSGLNQDIKALLMKYKEEYILGLQGPDLLFFYKPYTGKYISHIGSDIHSKEGQSFLNHCKEQYDKTKNESFLAYVLGCTCHYTLDKELHPFVYKTAPKSSQHHRLESEFDSLIGDKYKLEYPKNRYLPYKEYDFSCLGLTYGISGKTFKNSLKDFRRYSRLLQNRKIVAFFEKLFMQKPMFSQISPQDKFVYEKETKEMEELFENALHSGEENVQKIYNFFVDIEREVCGFECNFEGKEI